MGEHGRSDERTTERMKTFVSGLVSRAADLSNTQPLLGLALGAALLALFLKLWGSHPVPQNSSSLSWTLYQQARRLMLAAAVVLLMVQALAVMRGLLRRSVAQFQQSHGRITEANYEAVQTIWGSEQAQRELTLSVSYEEEVTERTEFEDPTKPALIRKKTVRRTVPGNPFVSATHNVTLRQNPRKKGSALYGGYDTECSFSWKLKSPADRPTRGVLRFPLPAQGGMYDALTATLNGADILPKVELTEAALVLVRDLAPHEEFTFAISFKSRGMAHWYFQVQEQREIRDFTLTLTLPDIASTRLNYPEGCMSPTEIRRTPDNSGSVLTYRLDHAISHKGMGISLPTLPQPGATTSAVLCEAERAWMLMVATTLMVLTLHGIRNGGVVAVLFGAAFALAFAFLGDFSDLLFGFWGTAIAVFVPLLLALAWLARRIVPGRPGTACAALLIIFGVGYPSAAGLDPTRQGMYLHLCGLAFLLFTAWLLWPQQKAQTEVARVS
jgi:hypothetical protein